MARSSGPQLRKASEALAKTRETSSTSKKGRRFSERVRPRKYTKITAENIDYKDLTLLRRFISDKGKVTERFTRVSDKQVLYEYTVEDASRYSQPWKGQMPLNTQPEGLYEYACLEGNYSMFNLLAGARALDREGRKAPMRKAIFAGVE